MLAPTEKKKTLVIANGTTGDRAALSLEKLKRPFLKIDKGQSAIPSPHEVEVLLKADPNISHVWIVHCETSSGIVNPIAEIGHVVKALDRVLMVDATSSFGALPINMGRDDIDVLVSSSTNCIEGVPGLSYVLLLRSLLVESQSRSHSVALDLYEQWKSLDDTGQFRFPPPAHVVAAFHQALIEHTEEGGTVGRLERYQRNAAMLHGGMVDLGLTPLLPPELTGPLVQSFVFPRDPNFDFAVFQKEMRARGFAISPGVNVKRPVIRICTMGEIDDKIMRRVIESVADVFAFMNVSDLGPAS